MSNKMIYYTLYITHKCGVCVQVLSDYLDAKRDIVASEAGYSIV